jgi:hypothetical protein
MSTEMIPSYTYRTPAQKTTHRLNLWMPESEDQDIDDEDVFPKDHENNDR